MKKQLITDLELVRTYIRDNMLDSALLKVGDVISALEKTSNDLEAIAKTQCEHGNWNCNPYMWGMANGLLLALATIRGEEPQYKEKPEVWLDDLPHSDEPATAA